MKKNQGFTLIELLVVIAIIGILASVVLASLNSARNKGADAAVKSNLANARAQAEIFYDSNTNSYNRGSNANNVCHSSGVANGIDGIYKNILSAAKSASVTNVTVGAAATSANSVCNASDQSWVATAPLKNPVTLGNVHCVDSTGFSGEVVPATAVASGTDYSCN